MLGGCLAIRTASDQAQRAKAGGAELEVVLWCCSRTGFFWHRSPCRGDKDRAERGGDRFILGYQAYRQQRKSVHIPAGQQGEDKDKRQVETGAERSEDRD